MKSKKKYFTKAKIIFVIFTIVFFGGYLLLANSVGNYDSMRTLKQLFPQEFKEFVKKKIFFYNYQKYIEKELEKSVEQNRNNYHRQEFFMAVKEKEKMDLVENYGYMNIKKQSNIKNFQVDNKELALETFKTSAISIPKYNGKGTAYLEYDDKNLIITSATGMFFYVNIDEFNNDSFEAKVIKTNIREKIRYNRFYIKNNKDSYGIKDLFILNKKIYFSYNKQENDTNSQYWRNNCYNTAIMVADLNYEYLEFKEFFTPKNCIKEEDERYVDWLSAQSGGRIVEFKDNKLLFSIGDYRAYVVSQEKSNFFGKIISLDLDGKNPEIISMGHRNPQGLFYDKKNDIIFSTEHGPDGGDEVNHNISPGGEIENYGWPISSYGDHKYDLYDRQLYKLFPLHKSHSKYGFVEPLKYFYPSIGISEIVKLENDSKDSDFNILLVASMGSLIKEGDLSLHYIKTDKNFKMIDHKILELNERIRDIKYIKELNKVFLFFDTSASIGVLSLK
tara:strand:+ start:1065 stop:2573 length:1509 start_codon:yes stop_codon:yes gene_type:complete